MADDRNQTRKDLALQLWEQLLKQLEETGKKGYASIEIHDGNGQFGEPKTILSTTHSDQNRAG